MVQQRSLFAICLAALATTAMGCRQETSGTFVSSKRVTEKLAKYQPEITKTLDNKCGKAGELRILGRSDFVKGYFKRGADLYTRNCMACHGFSGDGNGPAAAYLLPRPRDYRPGVFKFTSTSYGMKPLRADLIRTVRRGIAGTSMPSFHLMSTPDVEAVVDYVIALSMRGELENQLADSAEFNESIDQKEVPEMINRIVAGWNDASNKIVYPATPMPNFTVDHIVEGRKAFRDFDCIKCHGDDGRGQTAGNVGVDAWGNPTKAADLTSGMLRGGTEPLDIYRHIDAGINGTPMPSFHGNFQKSPETIWKIVAHVLDMSNTRRKGSIPDAGMLKPLPGVEVKEKEAAASAEAGSSGAKSE